MVFETTWPAWRIRYSRSAHSFGRSSILPARAAHLAREEVQLEVADREARGLGRPRGAAHEGLHARQELGEREGLDQVVVAARLQAAHAVVHRVPRAQEQDGRAHARGGAGLDEAEAVQAGQHDVDDGRVVGRRPGPCSRPSLPVARAVHGEAGLVAGPWPRRPRSCRRLRRSGRAWLTGLPTPEWRHANSANWRFDPTIVQPT